LLVLPSSTIGSGLGHDGDVLTYRWALPEDRTPDGTDWRTLDVRVVDGRLRVAGEEFEGPEWPVVAVDLQGGAPKVIAVCPRGDLPACATESLPVKCIEELEKLIGRA